MTADEALAAADASDARTAQGKRIGPLDGACFAVKDNIDLRGHPTSAGIAHYRDAVAAEDAPVIERLRAAGAVIVGKTNMHEAALGVTTDNSWFGRCENPRYPGFSPGGSSGGSAAAVAGGLAEFALGTDSAGSVRIPAAFCGIAGFKPTRGLLAMGGIIPLSPTLDTLGLFAPDAARLALAWRALLDGNAAGGDTGMAVPSLSGVRLGFLPGLLDVDADPEIRRMHDDAIASLREAGAALAPMDWPWWNATGLRRDAFLLCEIEGAAVHAQALQRDPQGFSSELRAMLAYGAKQSPDTADRIRTRFAEARARLLDAFAAVDAIVLPVTPATVPRQGQPTAANLADLTAPGSIGGLPCISIPWGATAERTPLALQLLAAPGRDAWLLELAARIEVIGPRVRADPL